METNLLGYSRLHNRHLNKGTAFTLQERERYRLQGLLPAAVSTQKTQIQRSLQNLRRKGSDIERYITLHALWSRNERLFYRLVMDHIEELLPIIYTPTVGQACLEFSHIFRQTRGLYITRHDKGRIRELLWNWPESEIRVIVITDGQRILGLGDLGASGMGIPIGKLSLYTACAGIPPHLGLPVMLDVGTNNQYLLEDPLYLGDRVSRLEGEAYQELVDEFVDAVQEVYPDALIQWEDFLSPNAYYLLGKYRNKVLSFNDDIQGTAAVVLAGVYAACRVLGQDLPQMRILFLGAGSAATGIGDLIQEALCAYGLTREDARKQLWFVDVNGLVTAQRTDLQPHNLPYAHDHEATDLMGAIRAIRPQMIIGATGVGGTFTRAVIEQMSQINTRPVILALSNPTDHAECTAEQAYTWSKGQAIYASGSPFAAVQYAGNTLYPAQSNNIYIFPGIGLAAYVCKISRITDAMFLVAAKVLSDRVNDTDLQRGALYPALTKVRALSLAIAVAVAEKAYDQNLAVNTRPADLTLALEAAMYDPTY
ncbi:MAG TPA: NAD-dependent malic enzyme [Gammaproteobacteria bacterium]|nr:NAD-dependent malic enzyme [Gammaproteobacteria bacterium]